MGVKETWEFAKRQSPQKNIITPLVLLFFVANFAFVAFFWDYLGRSVIPTSCRPAHNLGLTFSLFYFAATFLAIFYLTYHYFAKDSKSDSENYDKLANHPEDDIPLDTMSDTSSPIPESDTSELPSLRSVNDTPDKYEGSHKQTKTYKELLTQLVKSAGCHWCLIMVGLIGFGLVTITIYSEFAFWESQFEYRSRGGKFRVSVISEEVQIGHDENGILHVFAQNNRDLAFGQGYASARERLFQIEITKRAGFGELSEVFGEIALEADKLMRVYNFRGAVLRDLESLSPEASELLHSFTAGVNAFIDSLHGSVPFEFNAISLEPRHFEVVDFMVISKLLSLDLSLNYQYEFLRYKLLRSGVPVERIEMLMPPYPADAGTVLSSQDIIQSGLANFTQNNQRQHTSKRSSALTLQELERLKNEQKDISRERAYAMKNGEKKKYHILDQLLGRDSDPLIPRARASNNWVVAGSVTSTGKPIVANDPHLEYSAPMVWILYSLHTPERNLTGAALPGIPGIILGSNEKMSWGYTNVGTDVQDLFIIDMENSTHYWSNGTILPITYRSEVIPIKESRDLNFTIRETIYGPIITDIEDDWEGQPALALKWISIHPDIVDRTYNSLGRMNLAQNISAFREAYRDYLAPAQNVVFATSEGGENGEIGYQCIGKIPLRDPSHSGKYPVHSNTSLNWRGFVEFDYNPYVVNPPEDFIASANNKIIPTNYPVPITQDWEERYRYERISQMITTKISRNEKISPEDIQEMQTDVQSHLYFEFRPLLENLNRQNGNLQSLSVSNKYEEARQMLLEWNGDSDADEYQPALFWSFWARLVTLPESETNRTYWDFPRYFFNVFLQGEDDPNCHTETTSNCLEWAAQALSQVADEFFANKWKWGEKHQAIFENPVFGESVASCLYNRRVPKSGSFDAVNVGSYNFFPAKGGPSYREIIDTSSPINSFFVMPMGNSESFFSKFYDNLLDLWENGKYVQVGSPSGRMVKLLPRPDDGSSF